MAEHQDDTAMKRRGILRVAGAALAAVAAGIAAKQSSQPVKQPLHQLCIHR